MKSKYHPIVTDPLIAQWWQEFLIKNKYIFSNMLFSEMLYLVECYSIGNILS